MLFFKLNIISFVTRYENTLLTRSIHNGPHANEKYLDTVHIFGYLSAYLEIWLNMYLCLYLGTIFNDIYLKKIQDNLKIQIFFKL